MKKLILLFLPWILFAAVEREVEIGVQMRNVYNLDWRNQTADVSFWVWYDYEGEPLNLIEDMGVQGASDVKILYQLSEVVDGVNWTLVRYRMKVQQDWHLKNFPFIKESVTVSFSPDFFDQKVRLVPQVGQSLVNKDALFASWKYTGFDFKTVEIREDTNYGNPFARDSTTYPVASFKVHFERVGYRMFFRLFSVLYLSYLLSLAVFYVPLSEMNSKTNLIIGSVFAAIGNHFVLEATLPPISEFMLADKLQVLTFILIIATIGIMVMNKYLFKREKKLLARRIDHISGLFSLIIFALGNWYFISRAMNAA